MTSELETQLVAAPGDVALRLVLADALEQRGDPRGALIHLQHALATTTNREERDRLRASIAELLGRGVPELSRPGLELEWELGFVRAATITHDPLDTVSALLAHPAGRLVRDLTVAVADDQRAALAERIAARPRPSLLRALYVGRLVDGGGWVGQADAAWAAPMVKALGGDDGLAVRPVERYSHVQLDAMHEADTGESRNELRMHHIAPVTGEWRYSAELVIRPGCHAAVMELHDDFSEWVQYLLALRGDAIELYQSSDRTHAGYGNLYRAIRGLAPLVEDVRFTISDWSEPWIDEYAIVDGQLRVSRGIAEEGNRDYWTERAASEPDDHVLRRFAARMQLASADSQLRNIDRLDGARLANAAAGARDALDRAAALDDLNPELWQKRGELARVVGDLEASERAFARQAELDASPGVGFDRALVAFTAGDDARAAARLAGLVAVEPSHTGAQLLAAYLTSLAGRPADLRGLLVAVDVRRRTITPLDEAQRVTVWTAIEPADEDLVRTGRHVAILEWCIEAFASSDATLHAPAAAYLLGWAEIHRIRAAHKRNTRASAALAGRLYAAAARLDPLAGSVHYYWSIFLGKNKRATKCLEDGLAAGPDHLGILGALGAAARAARDYDRAIALLDRYVRVFRGHHTGGVWGIYWDFHLAELSIAHYENACMLLYGVPPGENRPPGKPSTEALDRAEAALEPALAMYETLSYSQRKAGAGVFQCKSLIAEFRGDHAAALTWADRALEANDDNAYLWSTKGGCLNNLGRLDEAVTCCERALALDDKHWHAHLVIACVLAKRDGARDEIYKRLQRVVKLWPESRSEIAAEPDFARLRDEPAFQKLVRKR